MMRTIRLVVLALVVSGHAGGADNASQSRESPMLTGRNWVRLSTPEKIAWISGYSEARITWEVEIRQKTPGCMEEASFKQRGCLNPDGTRSHVFYFPVSLTLGEISESLDHLYSEPTNRLIPVVQGLAWVYLKGQGASEAALKQWESTMRACFVNGSTCPLNPDRNP